MLWADLCRDLVANGVLHRAGLNGALGLDLGALGVDMFALGGDLGVGGVDLGASGLGRGVLGMDLGVGRGDRVVDLGVRGGGPGALGVDLRALAGQGETESRGPQGNFGLNATRWPICNRSYVQIYVCASVRLYVGMCVYIHYSP